MKIITSGKDLSALIIKFIKNHSNFSFAVAWASSNIDVMKCIYKNKDKIRNSAIGIHFYQTDPDVLNAFIDFNQVHFILQPSGVFHPKSYIFWSGKNWDIIIGSANMTKGAFTTNKEISFYINSKNVGQQANLGQYLRQTIRSMWADGIKMDTNTFKKYSNLRKVNLHKFTSISCPRNNKNINFTPLLSEIMSMAWDDYYSRIKNDPNHSFSGRCEILRLANKLFSSKPFSDMDDDERIAIAGLSHNFHNLDWGWFGGMTGAGKFHNRINNNNIHISRALDLIPLHTPVRYSDYDKYINEFLLAFPKGGAGVGVASRLLAMKRPDYFVCYNKGNKHKLCNDFHISQLKSDDYKRYWDDIIEKILDSVWWNSEKPKVNKALSAWEYRSAMLDSIFYEIQ